MGTIGCPDEYEALIVDSASQDTIAFLPWSSISWQRVRNGWSEGSVKIAAADGGIECCNIFGGLSPWSQMLRIERNGHTVWDGPIMGWGRETADAASTRDVVIRAKDRGVIADRRFLDTTYDFNAVPADYGTAMASMLAGSLTSIPFPLIFDGALADVYTTNVYHVERLEPVSSILAEMTDNLGQFYTCRRDTLYVFGELAMWQTRVPPTLNEQTVLAFPQVEVDASDQVTLAFAGTASAGLTGFPVIGSYDFSAVIVSPLSAILHGSVTSTQPELGTDVAAMNFAAQVNGVERAGPKLTIEAVPVSPEFGAIDFDSDLDTLMPGMRLRVDFIDTCAFNVPVVVYDRVLDEILSSSTCEWVRVDQIDVSVERGDGDGINEDVQLSCVPWIVDPRSWTAT